MECTLTFSMEVPYTRWRSPMHVAWQRKNCRLSNYVIKKSTKLPQTMAFLIKTRHSFSKFFSLSLSVSATTHPLSHKLIAKNTTWYCIRRVFRAFHSKHCFPHVKEIHPVSRKLKRVSSFEAISYHRQYFFNTRPTANEFSSNHISSRARTTNPNSGKLQQLFDEQIKKKYRLDSMKSNIFYWHSHRNLFEFFFIVVFFQ